MLGREKVIPNVIAMLGQIVDHCLHDAPSLLETGRALYKEIDSMLQFRLLIVTITLDEKGEGIKG
ncbi:hypothetical protein VB10N_31440 [Vibrio sp. 10N]|nr:hypothetical protein VB10N_31440 [Vibrio sp. 10N]